MTEDEQQENQRKLVWLKAAIAEGMASGVVAEDADVVFDRLEQRIRDRAAAKRGENAE